MSFLRAKKVKGKPYFYLVENVRKGAKTRQLTLHYFGDICPPAEEVLLRRLIIILKRELTRRIVAILMEPVKSQNGKHKKKQDPTIEITWAGGKTILTASMEPRDRRTILRLLLHCP